MILEIYSESKIGIQHLKAKLEQVYNFTLENIQGEEIKDEIRRLYGLRTRVYDKIKAEDIFRLTNDPSLRVYLIND